MKKFLALMIAMLMLLSAFAFAEEQLPADAGTDAAVDAAEEQVSEGNYTWMGNEAANYMLALNKELIVTSQDEASVSFANEAQTLIVAIEQVDPEGATLEDYTSQEGVQLIENGISYALYVIPDEEMTKFGIFYFGDDGMEYDIYVGYATNDEAAYNDACIIVGSMSNYDASRAAAL